MKLILGTLAAFLAIAVLTVHPADAACWWNGWGWQCWHPHYWYWAHWHPYWGHPYWHGYGYWHHWHHW